MYHANESKKPQKASCKYLGLHIDGKMIFSDHIDYVVKKLDLFSGLVYKVRHLYLPKCLLWFYNWYAESVIMYEKTVYGSAAKTNIERIEKAQRRIWRAIFFKESWLSENKIIEEHKLLSVFQLYVLEVLNEVIQTLKHESPLDSLIKVDNPCTIVIRRIEKRLLHIEFSRTKIKSTSIENILRKGYNLMKEFDLIPDNLNDLSIQQVKIWFKKYLTS